MIPSRFPAHETMPMPGDATKSVVLTDRECDGGCRMSSSVHSDVGKMKAASFDGAGIYLLISENKGFTLLSPFRDAEIIEKNGMSLAV